jgi:hypothetical protein
MYEVCPKCYGKTGELDNLQVLAAMIDGRKIIKKAMTKSGAEEEVMVSVKLCGSCETMRRDRLRLQRKVHEQQIRKSRIYERAAKVFRTRPLFLYERGRGKG